MATTSTSYDVGSQSFPTPPNPLASFTHAQKETFEKFKNIVFSWDLTQKEKEHLSDLTLYRYMHGYQWRIEKACNVLKKTLEWRAKAKPENFRVSEVAEFHKLGYLYQYGFDKQGRPVLYIVLKRNKLEATEENQKLLFKHFCMIYEQCTRKMRGNVYDVTYVVDLKDCPLSVSLIKNLKSTFDELGEYYSERMSKIILVNYGWTLGILWACVKPFLEEHVVAKYKFLSASKPEEIRQHLIEYIDMEQLVPDFHGGAPFNFSLENELKREEEELKKFPA